VIDVIFNFGSNLINLFGALILIFYLLHRYGREPLFCFDILKCQFEGYFSEREGVTAEEG